MFTGLFGEAGDGVFEHQAEEIHYMVLDSGTRSISVGEVRTPRLKELQNS